MFVCQRSLDVVYGKQREALGAVLTGYLGASASHVVDEYVFESLADFERALADMAQPQFEPLSDALAPFVVPGSQKRTVYRVVD